MNRNEENGAIVRFRPEKRAKTWAEPEAVEAVVWADGTVKTNAALAPFAGTVTEAGADDLRVGSAVPALSAVVVKGQKFDLNRPDIRLSGTGVSDFTSRGAALLADECSDVTVRDGSLVTSGCCRAATIATRGSTLRLYRTTLDSRGGPLPEGYVPVIGPGMLEPPAPLGLGGDCRTHLSMDNSETYFYDCVVRAAGWAALSTDASGGYVYLEANNTRVDMEGNGYCVYADNGCHTALKHCRLSSGNMAAIQDGNSSVVFEDTDAVCAGVGFLLHGGMEARKDTGLIRLTGGSIESREEIFRCKSTNADIYIQKTDLRAGNGVLLRTMLTDDAFYYRNRTRGAESYGVQLTLEALSAVGDVRREDPERRLHLSLDGATLRGALTGGVELSLTGGSCWEATGNSQIVLHADTLDGIDAANGVRIAARAGEGCTMTGVFPLPGGGVLSIAETAV